MRCDKIYLPPPLTHTKCRNVGTYAGGIKRNPHNCLCNNSFIFFLEKDIIRKFDDCSMLNEIDIIDPFVLAYEKEGDIPSFGRGCKSLQFKCRAPGHSRVNIKYTLDGSKNISYSTTVVLSCFKELKVLI